MRDDVNYLLSISNPSKDFNATKFLAESFRYEFSQLSHASIHSILNEKVVKNGYPIPIQEIDESAYINRLDLEKRVDHEISDHRNLLLIGCEGSGKSSLLHYTISKNFTKYNSLFSYIDASDIGVNDTSFANVVYSKIRNALFMSLSLNDREKFIVWVKKFEDDPFAHDLINTGSTQKFVEAILVYLSSEENKKLSYFVIDNIDSVNGKSVLELFNVLHRLTENVNTAFKTLNQINHDSLRYIITCRTQTIDLVKSASQGLFLSFPASHLDMDRRFTRENDMLELMTNFLNKEKKHIFKSDVVPNLQIRAGAVQWSNFIEYANDALNWLAKSSNEVNKVVNKFCGRSIRRSKLFLIKALDSPVIARLVFLEKHLHIKNNKDYIVRRMYEALFDFSTAEQLKMIGYPLNPFKVLRDDRNFRDNPLIGIVSILYMQENLEKILKPDVHFAHAIDASNIIEYLQALKYSDDAIIESIESFILCGLLRPVNGAAAILHDVNENFSVFETYIIDEQSLKAYYDLLMFANVNESLTFYNMALRAKYNISADHKIDDIVYDVYTFLVFLSDLIEREIQLEKQIKSTGVMLRPLTSQIRNIIFIDLLSKLDASKMRFDSGSHQGQIKTEQALLINKTYKLFEEVRYKLSNHPGII